MKVVAAIVRQIPGLLLAALLLIVFFAVPLMACPLGCGAPLFSRFERTGLPDRVRVLCRGMDSSWGGSLRCPGCHQTWTQAWYGRPKAFWSED
ncbi:MAG TPA: hypothetical protein VE981_01325 [Planctomycetota bacterium]|nr:hypothetical protein [Planctomycetota bacterium]